MLTNRSLDLSDASHRLFVHLQEALSALDAGDG
jgi:hypothetical protein